jgi:hypothetical protein
LRRAIGRDVKSQFLGNCACQLGLADSQRIRRPFEVVLDERLERVRPLALDNRLGLRKPVGRRRDLGEREQLDALGYVGRFWLHRCRPEQRMARYSKL